MGNLRNGFAASSAEPDSGSESAHQIILVVDDEEEIRTVLRLALTRGGYDVREADSGEAALSLIQEERPDLVLLDVMMPGMDGFAVCRQLRADTQTADLPVIILSAKTDSRSKQEGLEAGATKYLTKPLSPDQLILHVNDTLAGRSGRPQVSVTEWSDEVPKLEPGEYDVVLNGVDIHYTVRGSGPPLVAHSGGPGFDARSWDDFAGIDAFFTVIAIHPRGSGLSGPAPNDAYRLADYAADLEALVRYLGLEKPALMGWSHGGMVAQQFAVTYPDALSKLILFDTAANLMDSLGDLEASVQAFRDQPWFEDSYAALQKEWAGDYETDEDMARLWAAEMKFYFREFDSRAEAYHERTKDLPISITPLRVFNEQEAETFDLRPRLNEIAVPTLVIVGRHDFITNVTMAEEMVSRIPDARLELFEDSGHYALVEEPEKFRRVLKEFVLGE